MPTHEEANVLRARYALGDTTADEWAVIRNYLRPTQGKPPAYRYTAKMKDGVWIIADGETQVLTPDRFEKDGTPKHHFEDRSAAWRHIDELRDAAGCGMPTAPSAAIAVFHSRPPAPRTWRGH